MLCYGFFFFFCIGGNNFGDESNEILNGEVLRSCKELLHLSAPMHLAFIDLRFHSIFSLFLLFHLFKIKKKKSNVSEGF